MRETRCAARLVHRVVKGPFPPQPQNVLAQAYMASLEALDLTPHDVLARDQLLSSLLDLTGQVGFMPRRQATDWLVSAMVDRYQNGFVLPN